MHLTIRGNFSPDTLHRMAKALSDAAERIRVHGWCRDSLREEAGYGYNPETGRWGQRPSRVCMMGAIQATTGDLPTRARFRVYDFVHQALDGVPMQDFNDAQNNPKPVIRKLVRVAAAIEERAALLEARRAVDGKGGP